MDNLKAQGTQAFIWDFSGKIAMHGIVFIVTILLTRILEPSDFGLIAMVMVVIGMASVLMDLGLGAALVQRRRLLPIHYSSVFYFNIILGMTLALITFFSAPSIANFYGELKLIPLMQAISILFVINAFSAVQSTKLQRDLNYKLLTKVSFVSSLVGGVFGIVLALYGIGVWALVAQAIAQGIAYNIMIWTASHWKPEVKFSLKALKQLWTFGFRMFLSGLLENVYTRLDTVIIGKLFSPMLLGYFSRAKSLDAMVVTYSSSSLMSVLFPLLSKVQNDLSRFQNIIIKSFGIIVFVTFFLIGGMYLVSHELIILLFGEKWLPSVDYFKILALSSFGYPISALLVNVLSSRGKSKDFLRLEIYKKIIGFSNLAIAFSWGIKGYLYGLIVVTFVGVYANIIFVSKEITLPKWLFVKSIMLQIVITIFSVTIIWFLNKDIIFNNFSMLLLKGSEYAFLYIILNIALKTESYVYFMNEFRPMYKKLLRKFKNDR